METVELTDLIPTPGPVKQSAFGKGSLDCHGFAERLCAPVSAACLLNVRRICGKTRPVIAARVHSLRDEYTGTIEPARALGAETLSPDRIRSDLVNPSYALTPAEIDLMWKTAPPRVPIRPPNATGT